MVGGRAEGALGRPTKGHGEQREEEERREGPRDRSHYHQECTNLKGITLIFEEGEYLKEGVGLGEEHGCPG